MRHANPTTTSWPHQGNSGWMQANKNTKQQAYYATRSRKKDQKRPRTTSGNKRKTNRQAKRSSRHCCLPCRPPVSKAAPALRCGLSLTTTNCWKVQGRSRYHRWRSSWEWSYLLQTPFGTLRKKKNALGRKTGRSVRPTLHTWLHYASSYMQKPKKCSNNWQTSCCTRTQRRRVDDGLWSLLPPHYGWERLWRGLYREL